MKSTTKIRTKKLYTVYLVRGDKKYFSKSYIIDRAAAEWERRLKKKFGPMGYDTKIEVMERIV